MHFSWFTIRLTLVLNKQNAKNTNRWLKCTAINREWGRASLKETRREELTHSNIYWYSCFSPVLITCSPFLALSFSHTLYIMCARSVPFVTMLYKRPVNTTIMFNRELNTVLKGLWESLRLLNNNNIITTVFLPFRWRKKKEKTNWKSKKNQRTVFSINNNKNGVLKQFLCRV